MYYHDACFDVAFLAILLACCLKFSQVQTFLGVGRLIVSIFGLYAYINLMAWFYLEGTVVCHPYALKSGNSSYGMVVAHVVFGWFVLITLLVGLVAGVFAFIAIRKAA